MHLSSFACFVSHRSKFEDGVSYRDSLLRREAETQGGNGATAFLALSCESTSHAAITPSRKQERKKLYKSLFFTFFAFLSYDLMKPYVNVKRSPRYLVAQMNENLRLQ